MLIKKKKKKEKKKHREISGPSYGSLISKCHTFDGALGGENILISFGTETHMSEEEPTYVLLREKSWLLFCFLLLTGSSCLIFRIN